MSQKTKAEIRAILVPEFGAEHVDAALDHFSAAVKEYEEIKWEPCLQKISKFVEAILKALAVHTSIAWEGGRKFKAEKIMTDLERLGVGTFDDSIRLSIPRNCRFIYDIASNRGARHDPHLISPNKMDAVVSVRCMCWVLAELVRLASKGSMHPEAADAVVERLMENRYPGIEDVDGRPYVNYKGLSAREIAILLLDRVFPNRLEEAKLVDLLTRHEFTPKNAKTATARIGKYIDRDETGIKLRGNGREEASKIHAKASGERDSL